MLVLPVALLLLQGPAPDRAIVRAESALGAGRIQAALQLATKIVARRPADPDARLLLGRVHFARRIIGRYPALEQFKWAARLDPTNPAPLYWQMKVGFYLRSDEGDVIAREALLRLFAVTPDYADAWQRFRDVYQNPNIWRRAVRALARHGDDPAALQYRAELLIALERGAEADSLLSIVTARGRLTPATCLLRSEASFQAGRPAAGYAWHDSALARADADSTGALWHEAWSIASPEEHTRHASTEPGERRAFFERFWEERDPNLLTAENERVREHYARRAEARRTYRLLHPQRTIYHSQRARTLAAFQARRDLEELGREEPDAVPGASSDPRAVANRIATVSWSVGTLQDTALIRAFRAGLTAQGLVFLRYGPPDQHAACVPDLRRAAVLRRRCVSHLDQESWLYWTPHGPLSISFSGNEYFSPLSREQLRSARVLLQTDRTTVPAPLGVRAWTAVFQSADPGLTDAYYKANGDSIAVVVRDGGGNALRVAGAGVLRVSVPAANYQLSLDVDSAGVLGRLRRTITVPAFSLADLELSSLVLAPTTAETAAPDREAALRDMPASLTYPAATPLAAYVEIYGLSAGREGRSQYRVRYSFAAMPSVLERVFGGGPQPVVFEFDRETASEEGRAVERLVIEPGRVPAGRYRVVVAVTDLTRNVKSESVALEIEIR